MIKSFRDQEALKIYSRERPRRFSDSIQKIALRKLRMLNNALTLNDLRIPPANRLEKLSGDRSGQYSIRINERWRISFRWEEGDAYDVEIVDYH